MSHLPESPVNPLPPVVTALFMLLMGIETIFQLGARGIMGGPEAIGWRIEALQAYGYSPDILAWMIETSRWPLEHVFRFVSYAFVHVSFTQALFAGVFLLALGKMVAEVYGAIQMLVVFVVASVSGAIVFSVAGANQPLFGAFPAVYGLIGTYTFLLWRGLALIGANQTRAFTLIAFLMGIQLIFAVFTGSKDWIADIGGFASGFAISFFLTPGGMSRLRDRMRRD